jgi:phosphoserine phosphatase
MRETQKNGASIAAFFDLDGTLLPEPSLERRFLTSLRGSDAVPIANYFHWAVEALRLLPGGLLAVRHANKRYLTGLNTDLVLQHLDSLTFFEEGIVRVAWHASQFHQIVLVTGTLHPLAQLAAVALECELEVRGLAVHVHIVATQLEVSRGYWTGRVAGESVYGAAKARAVVALAQQRQWNRSHCHAYGNALLDRDFLSVLSHGHAVNPGRELAAIANQHDWPIWHWHQEKKIAARKGANCISEIQSREGQA